MKDIRCVIADGATHSTFSSLWSNLLCCELVSYSPSVNKLIKGVNKAKEKWNFAIGNFDLPWHAIEKVKKGSFSTILWFHLNSNSRLPGHVGSWKAIALGDSNLFHIRNNELLNSFPVKNSKNFKNTPFLVPSKGMINLDKINQLKGGWNYNDKFILSTDALANYLLQSFEEGKEVLSNLNNINSKMDFEVWINQLRTSKEIKNDDTSIIYLHIHKSPR